MNRPHRQTQHAAGFASRVASAFLAAVLCLPTLASLSGCGGLSELIAVHQALKPASLTEWEGVKIDGLPYKNYIFRSSVAFLQTDADITVARTIDGISVRTDPNSPRKAKGSGAMGVLLTEDGYILTCQHVVDNVDQQFPLFAIIPTDDGTSPHAFAAYKARVVFRASVMQANADLALVKIDFDNPFPTEGQPPPTRRPEAFVPAPRIQTNPLSATGVAETDPDHSSRSTPVSGIRVVHHGVGASGSTWCAGRINELTSALDDTVPHWIVRTDLPLVPGDSGGPLVSEDGTLWGVAYLTSFTPGDPPDSLAVLPDAAWLDRLITRLRAEDAQRKAAEPPSGEKR